MSNAPTVESTPTAEEFIRRRLNTPASKYFTIDELKIIAIDFAKLHVQAALEAAAEKAKVSTIPNCSDHTPYFGVCNNCCKYDNFDVPSEDVDKESIINAYDLNLIKS